MKKLFVSNYYISSCSMIKEICYRYLYSGCEFGSSGWFNLAKISWGHMDGVNAENGPPGAGDKISSHNPETSTSNSSSEAAVSNFF